MTKIVKTRAAKRDDINAIGDIAEKTNLFPAEMLPEMIAPFLDINAGTDIWLVAELQNEIVGFVFCEAERMTEGTSNMLALGVHPSHQGRGFGGQLANDLEAILVKRGDRMLLVETLATPEFEMTRQFYQGHAYKEEARIRDYYDTGQGKVIFRKML